MFGAEGEQDREQDADVEVRIETDRHAAIEAVYRHEADRLWRALRLATGSGDVASEIVSEAFAQLLARGSVVHDARAWLWRSAFKIAAGEMQRRRRYGCSFEELPADAPEPLVDLERALGVLTPHQRTAIVLAECGGWRHSEIARVLGSTPAAVAVQRASCEAASSSTVGGTRCLTFGIDSLS